MNVRFHKEAADELIDCIRRYNDERPGLGYEFAVEVRNALKRIVNYPDAWPPVSKTMRKCVMRRFPFAVIYSTTSNSLYILAIMHLKRKPGYWKRRDSSLVNDG